MMPHVSSPWLTNNTFLPSFSLSLSAVLSTSTQPKLFSVILITTGAGDSIGCKKIKHADLK